MCKHLLQHAWRSAAAVVLVGLLSLPVTVLSATTDSRPILHVTGKITNADGVGAAAFDIAGLRNIGVSRVRTSTPWTKGQPVFEGVLVRDVLNAVGARGDTVVATALNDYRVEIPVSDFLKYPVILAYKMDGERLKVRDKGPLWIIYPQDEYPELRTKKVQSRWVWQVKELVIR
ncbi:MAG: molybdopterin-dependent oxidoreductase [Kiloniellaceae bacterium]